MDLGGASAASRGQTPQRASARRLHDTKLLSPGHQGPRRRSHGWQYTESQYKSAFPAFVSAVQALPGRARLIWATTTPVRTDVADGASNARVHARNAEAATILPPDHLTTDDLHALMSKHGDLHEDNVHFNTAGAALMGDQATALIRQALSPSAPNP